VTTSRTSTGKNQLTLISRLTESIVGRRWGFFVAELVLVVAGILIALAIDGWVSDAHNRQTEAIYLELLSRDITEVRQQAELQIEFEKEKMDIGIEAYKILDAPDLNADEAKLGSLLGALFARRTLNLSSATFDEIVSSGHLQLIRNRELRDHLVRFFAQMELRERIAEKNNQDLIDDIYIPFLMRMGITVQPQSVGSLATLNRASEILSERLGDVVVFPEDRILSAPADADSWNDIRRNLQFRIFISAACQATAEIILDEADAIAAAIASELDGR
jgi:hypothetical protein